MKRDSYILRGEDVSGLSSCLTLKMCNENCEESDLVSKSRSSSNLIHLDYVSTFKLDGAPLSEITHLDYVSTSKLAAAPLSESNISQAVGKYQTPHQSRSYPIASAYKYKSTTSLRQTKSPSSDPIEIFQRKRVVDSPTGSTMLMGSKSTITGSSSPDTETGNWLELGLGSTCSQVKKHRKINSELVNFTEYCSPSGIKEWNRLPLIPSSGIEKDVGKSMNTSFLNTCNQQAYQNHNTQAYSHFPHKLGESCSHRDVSPFISSSSCDQSFLQKAKFFSPPQQTRIAQQPIVLQNTINGIQSQIPTSNHGDFSWSKTTLFEPITWPGISDILSRRKFLSKVQIGTPQYQRQQHSQQFLTFEPLQAQTTPRADMLNSRNAILGTKDTDNEKPRGSDAGLWFMLQVAPTQDRDHPLPQISKAYLRNKDGTTTILTVKKYLASKLGLKSESEIEITCKGKEMLPFFTLQQVRDKIWFSNFNRPQNTNNAEISCASASASPPPPVLSKHLCDEYLMVLNYGRRATEACHPAID